ncbi:sugar ABC transporter substrate-binding protein [Paenibacillus hunanensis]|uniref:Multiple sugar transport system substrate-binding protein n=1 Tax=Paenibacillus hunanensis TaxID=539262 RepID=A0ABU1IZ96_9BACL|nr:sugar ABC transporter substrate-binding protein [Paenibacillus hunanensis]MCL9660076.1 sugar ABC transporter substrate-binding protein [Paenibacillus hunanensis]MDR6244592.1 multiple sugar transport system substrate-binding protein [Paenibacillus hunanensis]GGJ23108.1 sugar ABC transporter substrate-binding protein [Paenibacillus hunanensis]
MKTWWKPAISGLLIFSLLLAGCSGGNEKGTTSDGKRVLKVWGMGAEGTALSKLVPDFEAKHPDIKVDVQAIPWDNAHDKLLTAVASRSGPDVVQMGMGWIPEFAGAGALQDLTPYMDKYPNLKADNYFEGARTKMTYEGKTVGVPWYIDTRVLFYRKDLLKQVGYNEPPKTWDELKDAAKKLAARGNGNYGILLDSKDPLFTIPFAWENGSEVINSNKQAQLNQPPYVETIQYLSSFFKEGIAPTQSDMQLIPSFGEGILPMFISGPWSVNQVKTELPELKPDQWGTAVIPPKTAGGESVSVLGGSNLSVFSTSQNTEAAVQFISYLNDPQVQVKWYELTQDLPSTTKAWEDKAFDNSPNISTFRTQMDTARSTPSVKEWETIGKQISDAFDQIVVGGADIQTQLNQLNEQANSTLQSGN